MSSKLEKRRRPFQSGSPGETHTTRHSEAIELPAGRIHAFFADYGIRETIESILIAIVLALLFRAFEAEAFIIPTGSMAPTLQGQHIDLVCEKCGYQYRTGASEENSTIPQSERKEVIQTYCPICQYATPLRRSSNANHRSNQGDRILVNKFIYDFQPPERFDVIVFKYPNNGKQNFIKRLIGLPGENILIENGDIFTLTENADGTFDRKIARKPPEKLLAMLQTVDDTDYIAEALRNVQWPLRWQEWSMPNSNGGWSVIESGGKPVYSIDASDHSSDSEVHWLRYRHLLPKPAEWTDIQDGILPERIKNNLGRLIGDYYSYNDFIFKGALRHPSFGANWVGDLGLETLLYVTGESGHLVLDLVEAGAHFQCAIDLSSGNAELTCSDASVEFVGADGNPLKSTTAATPVRGTGKYHIRYVNADDEIRLWVNNHLIEFPAAAYRRSGKLFPTWTPADAGDAEPVGIAARGVALKVHRLRVLRDVYYTSIRRGMFNVDNPSQETFTDLVTLRDLGESPRSWNTPRAHDIFDERLRGNKPMFRLGADQFLPMGDNSPESSDARIWDGPPYVEEDLLLGRALYVYWPHALNEPVPYFPNFQRMGPIR